MRRLSPRSGPNGKGLVAGMRDHRWVIALAGGSGTRLAEVTRDRFGRVVPKQYCSLLGGRSLLGDAFARAERLVPPSHVAVVVAAQHEAYWAAELRGHPACQVIVQPHNRGTAAGVLLPLLSVAIRDPEAEVVLLPSDHFVADEETLEHVLRGALREARADPTRLFLVGIEPDTPEGDYGWIVPDEGAGPTRSVLRFVEKPDPLLARQLLAAGGVWNSFMIVGSARAFLGLYRRRQPELLAAFESLRWGGAPTYLQRLYPKLPEADFCRDLLEGSERSLGLCVAPSCGWTDLGTPARVADCVSSIARSPWQGVHPASLAAAVGVAPARGPVARFTPVVGG